MSKRKMKETKIKSTKTKRHEAAAEPVVTTLAPVKLSGVTKPDRIVQNGVRRPKDGGICASVWQELDRMRAAGIEPSTKDIREWSIEKGLNVNNSMAELSGWRRFHGISRSVLKAPAKSKPITKAAPPAVRVDGSVDPYIA